MRNLQDVLCERRNYSNIPNTHRHPFNQIIFPLKGSMEIRTEEYSKEIDEDIIFLIPNSYTHTYYAHKRNEFLVINIPDYFIDSQDIRSTIYFKMDKSWKSIRFLLLEELLTSNSHSKSLYHIVRLIAEKIKLNSTLKSIDYIHSHISEPIETKRLASIENLHSKYYTQWFKKRVGKTPIAYIREVRLNEAKKLLANTDLSITNISLQLGYNQLSSLNRLFYKYEGISPSVYRHYISHS